MIDCLQKLVVLFSILRAAKRLDFIFYIWFECSQCTCIHARSTIFQLFMFLVLSLRLQQRRPREVLADQGIIPRKLNSCMC